MNRKFFNTEAENKCMIWDDKYQPKALRLFCPVCGRIVSLEEWRDYGMHLYCTEHYKKLYSQFKRKTLQNKMDR